MPLFFLGTREWRNRQTRTVQVRVPVMEWGFNSPLAHDETADPSGSAVFVFLWLRWRCRLRVIGHQGYRTLRVAGRVTFWGYRTLRVAGGWRSAPLAFCPASFARRVGSKLSQALPQHLWPIPNQHVSSYSPRPLAPYSVNSHVIPLRLLQTLNLRRWNCNVFPRSRKITVLNYVRNLSGPGLRSPAVVAAKPSHRLRALRVR